MASQSLATSPLTETSQNEITIKCGTVVGTLYLDKLSEGGREGSAKCILYPTKTPSKNRWVTPVDFEALGGRGKSGKWKQSIKTSNNVAIGAYLSSLGTSISSSQSRSQSQISEISNEAASSNLHVCVMPLIDPILAFIKAYRLRGNISNLKQLVASHFDISSLTDAQKLLWDHCGELLKELGLSFHTRRNTDKRDAFDATLADILSAFTLLDEANKLPEMYCEATHLMTLPCLEPDPISKRLDTNHTALTQLVQTVDNLSTPLNATQKALEQVVSSLKDQLASFSSSVMSLSKSLTEHVNKPHAGSPNHGSALAPPRKSTPSPPSFHDRSANVILFGVPEPISLSDTRAVFDEVSCHLIGKKVEIKDAYRIGRKKESSVEPTRPRPLLIKLANCWDRRLLLSSRRNLKSFEKYKLFIREDLPPEARKTHSNPTVIPLPIADSNAPNCVSASAFN